MGHGMGKYRRNFSCKQQSALNRRPWLHQPLNFILHVCASSHGTCDGLGAHEEKSNICPNRQNFMKEEFVQAWSTDGLVSEGCTVSSHSSPGARCISPSASAPEAAATACQCCCIRILICPLTIPCQPRQTQAAHLLQSPSSRLSATRSHAIKVAWLQTVPEP